jgi:hypothetical protein
MMPTLKGTWIEMGVELIQKRREGLREFLREGSMGELPMSINSTHIPELHYHYILSSTFLLSVPEANH